MHDKVRLVKRFWAVPVLILALLSASLPIFKIYAQDVQNFTITSFDADYYLSRNSEKTALLDVTEKIVAQFPDFDQNHGILRAIPRSYQGHTVSLNVESVQNEAGVPLNYTTYEENDNLVLKIGDADRYVHGNQTYVINYSLRNLANLQSDHDEFYWDVNGDQWPQKFGVVNAVVYIPKDLAPALQNRQVCYSGFSGATDQSNCKISRQQSGDETVISASTLNGLNPRETLTFAIAFNDGTFELGPEVAREELIRKIMIAAIATAIILPPAVAFTFMFRRWRQFGDDPKGRGVIIPEYEAPQGLTSLTSEYPCQSYYPAP